MIAQCFKTQGLDKWASYILLLISTNNPLEVSIMILSSSYGPSSRSPVKYQLGKCRFPTNHPACCNVTCTELDSRMAFPRGHFLHLKTLFHQSQFHQSLDKLKQTTFKWNIWNIVPITKTHKINSWHLDHKEIQATAVWNLDLSYGNTSKNRNENSKWECSYRGYSLKCALSNGPGFQSTT